MEQRYFHPNVLICLGFLTVCWFGEYSHVLVLQSSCFCVFPVLAVIFSKPGLFSYGNDFLCSFHCCCECRSVHSGKGASAQQLCPYLPCLSPTMATASPSIEGGIFPLQKYDWRNVALNLSFFGGF